MNSQSPTTTLILTTITTGTSLALVLSLGPLSGCYGSRCKAEVTEGNSTTYRNPETGVCEAIGSPGRDCSSFESVEEPDWAICGSAACEQLGEIACIQTNGCRTIYANDANNSFAACWGTAPSGPDPSLSCSALDAYGCSRTDHCSATHQVIEAGSEGGQFVQCSDEKVTCTSSIDCEKGLSCTTNTRGDCLSGGMLDICYGFCEPNSQDPGSCVGQVSCGLAEPACPAGTIAGRDANCWTGYCIPVESCDATPACSTLNESECTNSLTCSGLYRGVDCTCTNNVCTCASYDYEGCADNP